MTPDEEKVVAKLRLRMKGEISSKLLEDESLFYRFCKARDFKIEEAEAMLRKHLIWRKETRLDTLLEEYKPPEVVKYIPFSFLCFDKDGCLIRYIDLGSADIRGIFKSAKRIDLVKFTFQILEKDTERLKQQSKKLGRCEMKSTYIFNFKGFSFANATHREFLETFIHFAMLFQDNYPERINKALLINVSPYASLAFSVVKHVLASALQQKIRFYGTGGYQEDLLQSIDADDLPAFLGGNRTDPDGNPLCPSFVIHGEKVPKQYHLRHAEKKLSKAPGVQKLTVTRNSKEERCFEVKEAGSYLEWEFETKTKDIGFVICYVEEEEAIELIPKQRIDTCYEPEKGLFKCEKPGKYVVVFDNSYSWIYPKEVYYRARVRAPGDQSVLPN
ncbi:unnamed protein product [Larinioides sclopetarius]|uniref:SEC14-like protein 2 n=1 Tax=Larinioides sclopetarius TaxID=280406 RepID=A0AAV2AS98_9ARAC